ncbi:uncharacterized protein BDZ99DRAFT_515783 [Mytilinidion resinicola]|uniref:C2H2-type domain-containing protein n=1 Tax=Mytilinidion resinicola TaxID=574789 RepID=A0A6A6Z1P3_9PEZI|nr:uncharacterized protein BDZ99DRAFT_515783 [Mytilinidion resinicola]KAF2815021.1 hypothetical protein BDZ99DRAFT_515783 [Mytilinidion resinicola]
MQVYRSRSIEALARSVHGLPRGTAPQDDLFPANCGGTKWPSLTVNNMSLRLKSRLHAARANEREGLEIGSRLPPPAVIIMKRRDGAVRLEELQPGRPVVFETRRRQPTTLSRRHRDAVIHTCSRPVRGRSTLLLSPPAPTALLDMVSYAQYPPTMQHDFELYATQEQQFDLLATSQPAYLPTSQYLDPSFSAPFDAASLHAFSEAPRSQDLRFHYDAIAQGVKPNYQQQQQYSPAGSPNSGAHSFDIQPPHLSTSSESGASVSSSAMGSPSLNPQYHDQPWGSVNGLGLAPGIVPSTSGFDYDGLVATDKYVGESYELSSSRPRVSSFPFSCASSAVSSNSFVDPMRQNTSGQHTPALQTPSPRSESGFFQTPTTPASAMPPGPLSMRRSPSGRRNSLLSTELLRTDILDSLPDTSFSSPVTLRSPYSQNNLNFIPPLEASYPTLIQPYPTQLNFPQSPYPAIHTTPSPRFPFIEQPPSPAPSIGSNHSHHAGSRQFKKGSQSPYLHTQSFQPYHNGFNSSRRQSNASMHSHQSVASRKSGSSYELDDESREKGLCPIPECGRVFKDLKAHMLTHQNERPEKCPIATCEYHLKGFARKYDKNRHTLTHYKGTMVCGFCPGSGSAAEKSFNRADVFKRHLTSVHGVEQAPPNSRKRSPSGKKAYTATQENLRGTCSTCSVTFNNAQDFYEHLDDCVLRVVQQADPSEAINQKLLSSVADDQDVVETMDRNGLQSAGDYAVPAYDEDEEEDEEIDVDDENDDTYGGGVTMTASGRKKRKNYPVSWGCATDKMKMKKRVLCVYDGPRRLWKDDMMLDQEFEVRMKLPDGKSYITDLDVQTLKRAEALHGATAEEKGPWVPDNIHDHRGSDLEEFMI